MNIKLSPQAAEFVEGYAKSNGLSNDEAVNKLLFFSVILATFTKKERKAFMELLKLKIGTDFKDYDN